MSTNETDPIPDELFEKAVAEVDAEARLQPAVPSATPTGFNYFVYYGGGIGPDVWDSEMQISAVDIEDAITQAKGRMKEFGGWVFMVSQEDYPLPTREELELSRDSALQQAADWEARFWNSWRHTCVHHNDAERKQAQETCVPCALAQVRELTEANTSLQQKLDIINHYIPAAIKDGTIYARMEKERDEAVAQLSAATRELAELKRMLRGDSEGR